jgi:hypothetical protein
MCFYIFVFSKGAFGKWINSLFCVADSWRCLLTISLKAGMCNFNPQKTIIKISTPSLPPMVLLQMIRNTLSNATLKWYTGTTVLDFCLYKYCEPVEGEL